MSKRSRRNARDFEQRSIYRDLPRKAQQFQAEAFGRWIKAMGGTCLHTTNQYEVARWRSWEKHDVAVLYKKADGTLTWTISSSSDYRAFLESLS